MQCENDLLPPAPANEDPAKRHVLRDSGRERRCRGVLPPPAPLPVVRASQERAALRRDLRHAAGRRARAGAAD